MDTTKSYARLLYGGNNKKVKEAVSRANEILSDPGFYNQIREIRQFDHSLLSSSYLAKILEECSMQIEVQLSSFFSSKESRADSHSQITINRWDFNTNFANRVNLLIHYTVEAVGHLNKNLRSEYSGSREHAPPVTIGNIAGTMANRIPLNELMI